MAVQPKVYTIEDFERYIALPENDDRRFELINGEIVEKLPTEAHGTYAATITIELGAYKRQNGGRVSVEARYRPEDDTRNDRMPDVSYTRADHLQPLVTKGAVLHMPDLAVEIQSENQSAQFMLDKAHYYLDNGASMVWIVYRNHSVRVLTPTSDQLLSVNDTIDGGDILPGFTLAVRAIFAE
ncbi:MAG: Uma2 family endonuclease [Chloroflexota bacterium]